MSPGPAPKHSPSRYVAVVETLHAHNEVHALTGGVTIDAVADALDVDTSTASRHLSSLAAADRLDRRHGPLKTTYAPV